MPARRYLRGREELRVRCVKWRGGRSQIVAWGHMAPGVLPRWRPNAARRWALAMSAGLPAGRPAQIAAGVVYPLGLAGYGTTWDRSPGG